MVFYTINLTPLIRALSMATLPFTISSLILYLVCRNLLSLTFYVNGQLNLQYGKLPSAQLRTLLGGMYEILILTPVSSAFSLRAVFK